MRRLLRFAARSRALLGSDVVGAVQSLGALSISAVTSLVAGLTLACRSSVFEARPGLLILVPAAIAARGNIFGAMGSRLGTAIHTGTFRLSRRTDTVVGQNIVASLVLTLATSLLLAVMAKMVAVAFDQPSISVPDFVLISTVGGLAASVVVLVITLALASGSARFGWDLDNVTAPLVTAVGDVVTLPALLAATWLIGYRIVSVAAAGVLTVASAAGLVLAWRSGRRLLIRIINESMPVLAVAGLIDLVAGVTIENRLDSTFLPLPVLLMLVPGYLGTAGALGGIFFSSRWL